MEKQIVVFFDVDETIIRGNINTTVIWHLFLMGLASWILVFRASFWFVLWKLGLWGSLESIANKGARELAGISIEELDRALDVIFEQRVRHKMYVDALHLIDEHRMKGHEVILLSSSFEPFVKKIGAYLSLPHVIATKLRVSGARYTGEIDGMLIGGNKHIVVGDFIAKNKPFETYAYTDHSQDIPMMKLVTHPVAVNPDMRLRRAARKNQWTVLDFTLVRN